VLAHVDDAQPTAVVTVAEHGTVELSLSETLDG